MLSASIGSQIFHKPLLNSRGAQPSILARGYDDNEYYGSDDIDYDAPLEVKW